MGIDPLVVVSYDPAWPRLFAELGQPLRLSLGDVASRIDHVGSTAVSGLDAKPIIDIQVSVHSLEPIEEFQGAIERCGFVWRPDNHELTKRYFREAPGTRRTHMHVRGAAGEAFGQEPMAGARDDPLMRWLRSTSAVSSHTSSR